MTHIQVSVQIQTHEGNITEDEIKSYLKSVLKETSYQMPEQPFKIRSIGIDSVKIRRKKTTK
jgi:hypothetical protein